MIKAKLLRILFLFLISLAMNLSVSAPISAKVEEDRSITNDTLSAGIIQNEGYYLAKSTIIPVKLRTPIDSRINHVGDLVTAQTTRDLMIGGHVVVPASSFLHGHITRLKPPGRFYRRAKIDIHFDTLSLPGSEGQRHLVSMEASINNIELNKVAKRVNDRGTYKNRLLKYSAIGAGIGSVGSYGTVSTLSSAGVGALGQFGYMMGGAVAGAVVASSLIKKDDIRMETGTDMMAVVTGNIQDNFEQFHPLSNDNVKDLAPEEAYDTFGVLKSEPLEVLEKNFIEKASSSIKEKSPDYL